MNYIIIKALITAIVVVLVSEIAKKSSLLAGILASIPLTSLLAFIWLYWDTNNTQKVIDLSNSIMLMIIPSFTFFIVLPISLNINLSFVFSMIIAIVCTIIVYWIYIFLLHKFGINI